MYDAEILLSIFVFTGSNWMYPVTVSLPDILNEPVNEVLPIKVLDPLVSKLPVTVWVPLNTFDPVLAYVVESLPSNLY